MENLNAVILLFPLPAISHFDMSLLHFEVDIAVIVGSALDLLFFGEQV